MFRPIFILTVMAAVLGLTAPNLNAAVDYGYAEALTDAYLPVESGSYDPCCPWLKWEYRFSRQNDAEGNTIAYEVDGATGTYRTYSDYDYSPGQSYLFSDIVYIGSSTYNNIKINLTEGDGGAFYIITGRAWYYNDKPE